MKEEKDQGTMYYIRKSTIQSRGNPKIVGMARKKKKEKSVRKRYLEKAVRIHWGPKCQIVHSFSNCICL